MKLIGFILFYIIAVIFFAIVSNIFDIKINYFLGGFIFLICFYLLRIFFVRKKYKEKEEISYPLMEAIVEGDEDKILMMIKNIDNINILNNGLSKAIEKNKVKIIRILLEGGAYPPKLTDLDYKNISLENLKMFLTFGADINEVTPYGDGVIHKAIRAKREDIIKFLLENGANINLTNYDHGDTPLHQQSYMGNRNSMKVLLDNGADINILSKSGCTPLLKAVQNDDIERVKILLEYGAIIDIKVEGLTALMLAIYKGDKEAVKLLLKYGANTDLKTSDGMNILDFAKTYKNYEIIDILEKNEIS